MGGVTLYLYLFTSPFQVRSGEVVAVNLASHTQGRCQGLRVRP